jgi:hypothetical protein
VKLVEPTAEDLHIAAHVGVLKQCPFCGQDPLVFTHVNENPEFSDVPIYRGTVSCTRTKCMATVGYNDRDKTVARAKAIEAWQRRV